MGPSTKLPIDNQRQLYSNGGMSNPIQDTDHRARVRQAKFMVGEVVCHRIYPFRGVIFDIDPEFDNTEEWWLAIPEDVRPRKDQPFYHLLAENDDSEYVAYVSEQNLLPDTSGQPLRHPQIQELFAKNRDGSYQALFLQSH
jgi:heat shock protein HspQ